MHLGTCPWEGPRCHRHRRRPTVALASLTLAVAALLRPPPFSQPTRRATTVAATAVTSASLTIPESEPSSAVAATATAVAVAATAVAVAVAAHRMRRRREAERCCSVRSQQAGALWMA